MKKAKELKESYTCDCVITKDEPLKLESNGATVIHCFKYMVTGPTNGDYQIEIHFRDYAFEKVIFDFKGTYTRGQWIILALIEKQIGNLEKLMTYKDKTIGSK